MNNLVRKFLIDLASRERTITYQLLSDKCHLGLDMQASQYDRAEIGKILGEISIYEHNNDRPLLSSIVITKGSGYEGTGFFKLAEDLGFGPWKTLREGDFDVIQIQNCFKFWSNKDNYTSFADSQ